MKHFYESIGGWFTYPELYKSQVERCIDGSHFVEVGVWKGQSAVYMAVEILNSGKKIKFDCVDNWAYSPLQLDIPKPDYTNLYETFLKSIEPVKELINPVRKLSANAAKDYADQSLDFVFIDTAHDYKNVLLDLQSWRPKVKVGGILAGHDFPMLDVKKALNKYFIGEPIKDIGEQCWLVQM